MTDPHESKKVQPSDQLTDPQDAQEEMEFSLSIDSELLVKILRETSKTLHLVGTKDKPVRRI